MKPLASSQMYPLMIVIIGVAICSGMSACGATVSHPVIEQLARKNQAVAVSPSNPYIAGNIFLSECMRQSPEVKGFITKRGAPPVLKVKRAFFGQISAELYYPTEQERYLLEESRGSWLIDGPLALQPEENAEVARIAPQRGTIALLPKPDSFTSSAVGTSQQILEAHAIAAAPQDSLTTPQKVTPKHAGPAAGIDFRSRGVALKPLDSQPTSTALSPAASLADLIAQSAAAEAEITPKGDLVHYVTASDERLAEITAWYTAAAAGSSLEVDSEKIARINKLSISKGSAALSPGDTIIIPSYLVKNRKRMGDEIRATLRSIINR